MEQKPSFPNGDPKFLAEEAERQKAIAARILKLTEDAHARAVAIEEAEAKRIAALTTNELPERQATAQQYLDAKDGRVKVEIPLSTKPEDPAKPKDYWWLK